MAEVCVGDDSGPEAGELLVLEHRLEVARRLNLRDKLQPCTASKVWKEACCGAVERLRLRWGRPLDRAMELELSQEGGMSGDGDLSCDVVTRDCRVGVGNAAVTGRDVQSRPTVKKTGAFRGGSVFLAGLV